MTTLIAIIALGVGGFILVMLAASPIDKAPRRAPSRRQVAGRRGPIQAFRSASGWRARATRAWKSQGRPAWRDVTAAATAWRNGFSADLRSLRAWAARRGIDEQEAVWVAAAVAVSVVVGYLVAHM